jgi:hypothetical protein
MCLSVCACACRTRISIVIQYVESTSMRIRLALFVRFLEGCCCRCGLQLTLWGYVSRTWQRDTRCSPLISLEKRKTKRQHTHSTSRPSPH